MKCDEYDRNMENEPLKGKIISLEWTKVECCNCQSREYLIRVSELVSEFWCEDCARAENYDE